MHELRTKAPKSSAVLKMEVYLSAVWTKIKQGEKFSLDELARKNRLSGTTATLLKKEGIVEKVGKSREGIWIWPGRMPDEELALQLLDAINVYNGSFKNSPPRIAPDIQEIELTSPASNDIDRAIESLKTPLNERLLSRAFRGSTPEQMDLFSGARSLLEEKLFISGSIASALYSTFSNPTEFVKQSPENIEDLNDAIVRASNDLLNKLISQKPLKK